MTAHDTTAAPVAGTTARRPAADRLAPGSGLVIGILMVSAFIVLLNEMLLGVALPTLITDLGITPTTGQWLTTGYLLTLAVLIPATGFLMRRFHLRTVFLASMSLFLVGTAIAAVAPGFEVLLAGRIVQAAGTAVFVPLLMTTTMRLVPESRRGQMMAVVTAVPAVAPRRRAGGVRAGAVGAELAVAVPAGAAGRAARPRAGCLEAAQHHHPGAGDPRRAVHAAVGGRVRGAGLRAGLDR